MNRPLLSLLLASSVLALAGVTFADSGVATPVQAKSWDGGASVLTGLLAGGSMGEFRRTPATGLVAGSISHLPPGPCRSLSTAMNAIALSTHIKPEVKRELVPIFLAEAAIFKCELTVSVSAGTPTSSDASDMLSVRAGK